MRVSDASNNNAFLDQERITQSIEVHRMVRALRTTVVYISRLKREGPNSICVTCWGPGDSATIITHFLKRGLNPFSSPKLQAGGEILTKTGSARFLSISLYNSGSHNSTRCINKRCLMVMGCISLWDCSTWYAISLTQHGG